MYGNYPSYATVCGGLNTPPQVMMPTPVSTGLTRLTCLMFTYPSLSKLSGTMRRIARRVFWVLLVVVPQVILILLSSWDKKTEMGQSESIKWNVTNSDTAGANVTNKTREAESNANKPRLNVIILTHMSSGSTFLGNLFNLHPDVFYLYEPFNELRMVVHGDRKNLGEWNVLDEKAEEAYRTDFSNLLRDFFTCNFQGHKTIDYLFPGWLRNIQRSQNYLAWRSTNTRLTKESVREACKSKRITVAKIMQTRFPGEIGIRELQRVCSSEPDNFECLIVHLVRDPRAVISSLIINKFYMPVGPKRKLITEKNTPLEGKEMIRHNSEILCSLLEVNLNYINEEWSNWFSGRYILVRYEDTAIDLLNTVFKVYNFTGLPMVASINNWILEGKKPLGVKNRNPAFSVSKNDVKRIEEWRFRLDTSQVSEFEKGCWPLMYMMGYISVNGSERVLRDTSQKLWTDKMPFLFAGWEW